MKQKSTPPNLTCRAIDTSKYYKPNQRIFHYAQYKFCIKHPKFLHLYTSRSLKTHRHASIEFFYCALRIQNYVNKSRCIKPHYNVILLHALYNHITWLLITKENKNVSCRKVCSRTKQRQKNLHLDSTKYLQHQSTAKRGLRCPTRLHKRYQRKSGTNKENNSDNQDGST